MWLDKISHAVPFLQHVVPSKQHAVQKKGSSMLTQPKVRFCYRNGSMGFSNILRREGSKSWAVCQTQMLVQIITQLIFSNEDASNTLHYIKVYRSKAGFCGQYLYYWCNEELYFVFPTGTLTKCCEDIFTYRKGRS